LARVFIHKPIDTKGMTDDNINELRNLVYQKIDSSLER
jgi:hypothetical protein